MPPALRRGPGGCRAHEPPRGADLLLDYSKHRATPETLRLLMAVARRARVAERGTTRCSPDGHINTTEDRAVLHVALRMPAGTPLVVDGQGTWWATSTGSSTRWAELSERIRDGGRWTGHANERIRAVVNIGIGGSDLGPAMAYEALRDEATPAPSPAGFVSNIDPGGPSGQKPVDLDPAEETVASVVSSKTFTDPGDPHQRRHGPATGWLRGLGAGPEAVARHFVAVSTNERGGGRVRDRPRQRARLLGLGGRPRSAGPLPRGPPRAPGAPSTRATAALVRVSRVVKVFELTTNNVSAGSRSTVLAHRSTGSMLETKRQVRAGVAWFRAGPRWPWPAPGPSRSRMSPAAGCACWCGPSSRHPIRSDSSPI